jgi:4-amino-4-deoxy-L-arabinose transferase-like glycosyltransferase
MPRVVAFIKTTPLSYWEIFEAKKLLAYGFWERHGAIINWHEMTGVVPNPWAFNYTHHPYPVLWLYTLAYYLGGAVGVIVLVALIGLASCLILYRILEAQYGKSAAWLAVVLYSVAPAAIDYDRDPNSVAMGAVVWPLVLWAFHLRSTAVNGGGFSKPWAFGLAVLIAGQVSWFSLSVLPAFFWLVLPRESRMRDALRHPLENAAWRAMGIGALATAGLFLLQFLIYTPSFMEDWHYFLVQSGMSSEIPSRVNLAGHIAAKTFSQVGPALWLAAGVAVVWIFKTRKPDPLTASALCYLALFAVAGLCLPHFFYVEKSMYRYLLFPAAILAALAFSKLSGRWLRTGVACLAVLGLAFELARVWDTEPSQAARLLGEEVGQLSHPEDVVLTNLQPMAPPYPSWDTGGYEFTRRLADRLMRFNIQDLAAAQAVFPPLRRGSALCVFIADTSKPLSTELESVLEKRSSEIINREIAMPAEPETLFIKMRFLYWRLINRYQTSVHSTASQTGPATVRLRIYRLRSEQFSQDNDGHK